MPERVQTGVFWLTGGIDEFGCTHRPFEGADEVVVAGNAPSGARKHKAELALRTHESPFPKHVEYQRSQRHGAIAGFRLRPADHVVPVSTLAHVQLAALEVDILPTQAAQF